MFRGCIINHGQLRSYQDSSSLNGVNWYQFSIFHPLHKVQRVRASLISATYDYDIHTHVYLYAGSDGRHGGGGGHRHLPQPLWQGADVARHPQREQWQRNQARSQASPVHSFMIVSILQMLCDFKWSNVLSASGADRFSYINVRRHIIEFHDSSPELSQFSSQTLEATQYPTSLVLVLVTSRGFLHLISCMQYRTFPRSHLSSALSALDVN